MGFNSGFKGLNYIICQQTFLSFNDTFNRSNILSKSETHKYLTIYLKKLNFFFLFNITEPSNAWFRCKTWNPPNTPIHQYTCMHACTCVHARTHARTHTHTHTQNPCTHTPHTHTHHTHHTHHTQTTPHPCACMHACTHTTHKKTTVFKSNIYFCPVCIYLSIPYQKWLK